MRDNYVGDIGDYFKYGLLRQLAGSDRDALKLGIAWYLYSDPCNPSDGKHLSYLNDNKRDQYRACDPELYDKLALLIKNNVRNVAEVRKQGVLPAGTVFHEEPLSLSHLPKGHAAGIQQRRITRLKWHERMLEATKAANLVFFDADNGLEVRSIPKHHDKGPKFTFYDELLPFWQRGQSLVIYQHRTRQGTAAKQIQDRIQALSAALDTTHIEAISIPAGSGRFFFIIPQPDHISRLANESQKFRKKFSGHITEIL